MLYDGELTRWRRTRAGYSREVFRARVEDGRPAAFGAVQPLSGGTSETEALRAYAPGGPDIAPGDYVAPGARGEADGRPAAFGAVQPLSGGTSETEALRAYAPGGPDIAPGDYVAPGARGEADPSDAPGVRRVVLATAYTLGGLPHHVEVRAR